MVTIHFETLINAPAQKVWNTMLEDKTYRIWTDTFNIGSYYEGSWDEGSKITFVGPNEKGELFGIAGVIAKNIPEKFVSIKYTGVVMNGVEDSTSPEVKEWLGSTENYTFTETGGKTNLEVELTIPESEKEAFEEMWPRALAKLKEMCEA